MNYLLASLTILTELGNVVSWLIASQVVYWTGRRREALCLALGVLVSYIASTIVKYVTALPRPPPTSWLVQVDSPYGFPSGHTAVAFFAATYLSMKNRKAALLFALAAFVAYSRLALGVHYLRDVVGGALMGVLIAFTFVSAEKRSINEKLPDPLLFSLSFVIAGLLYLCFPTRPGLAGGSLAGLVISWRFSRLARERLRPLHMTLGVLMACLLLYAYAAIELKEVRALIFLAFTTYPYIVHPSLFGGASSSATTIQA